ncbi:unnamed protein product [Symbiodinium natans]|uniref:Uncharacterized protein n=1 Tax=Symbiodinium natans TaxID=878477 RepID=A0A812N8L4_9DINO|nr:unnamed protein product [Symbiodinium natans]
MVRIATDKTAMPAAEVKMLGYRHANAFDWGAVARAAGDASAVGALYDACRQTKWRRSVRRPLSFAATAQSGQVTGPLGEDLATATVNLVASGQHVNVNRWSA